MQATNEISKQIKSLKGAARLEKTYALGEVAISILASELPASDSCTRLFRGEFFPFDESVTTKGIYVMSFRVLGDSLDAELNSMGMDVHQDSLLQAAKFHQEGHSISIWRDGKMHTLTMTPFVSLTSSTHTALKSATSVLSMQNAIQMGVFENEDGSLNSSFFSEIRAYLSKGYVPTVYAIDVPNDKIMPIEKLKDKTAADAAGMFIENSLNSYGEEEYITYVDAPRAYIKVILRFTGNPYEPLADDFWLVHRL